MKATGAQFDDRIIEVSWDPGRSTWKFLRFRDDKHDGNHISVVQNIIESISDGVEVDQVCLSRRTSSLCLTLISTRHSALEYCGGGEDCLESSRE